MGDNAGLQQAGLADSLIDEVSVTTFFEETPFTALIRANFDPSLWSARIPEKVNPSISLIITHIVRMLYNYHKSYIMDIILFWAYKKDFESWNVSWFHRLNSRIRYLFKQILRSYGVYTGPHRAHISQQLADLFDLDEAPEWPKDELREQGFIPASRFSEEGQEREAQRQIKRDQAAARLAKLRAIANTRAQDSAPNSIASSAGYQPRNSTADARRATSAPDGPEHHIPHTAPR
jgi:hypothetical protein